MSLTQAQFERRALQNFTAMIYLPAGAWVYSREGWWAVIGWVVVALCMFVWYFRKAMK